LLLKRIMRAGSIAMLALLAGCGLSAGQATASVTIKRQPPVIEHKSFDPAHPPTEMPHLNAGEAAVTESLFNCSVHTSYHVFSQTGGDGGCRSSVKIDAVQVDLQLKVTIWLPDNAPAKLIAHEEGHRRIAEKLYGQRALKAAQSSAAKSDGQHFTGTGKNCDEAVNAAVDQSDAGICQTYLNQTGSAAARVGDIYDDLTSHGTNMKLPEDEAIREAFEQFEQESHAK